MTNYPKISIITVSFNTGITIRDTINSVLSQSYEHIEYIIVDGASTDETIDILQSFGNKIDKIISESDAGIYDAMNKGIDVATGEWILFIGADDQLYDKDTIKQITKVLDANYHLIYGNVIKMPDCIFYDGKFNLFKLIYKNICHQAIFFNRNVFKIKGSYDLNYTINSDWEYNLKCFQDPKIKTKFIDQTVAYFNAEGLSSNIEDVAYEKRRKELLNKMPPWVKLCFKFRRSYIMKWVSKTFLNFEYA